MLANGRPVGADQPTGRPKGAGGHLTDAEYEAAWRSLYRAAQERIYPPDLPGIIADVARRRCLTLVDLESPNLSPEDRVVLVEHVAYLEARLIELGKLAGRERRAARLPGYPAYGPGEDLGPRFDAARNVDQVDLYQTLTGQTAIKTGNGRYRLRCPYHDDRSPSLVIYPPGRGWYCFVCGIGGSPVDFVMRLNHVNEVEALFFIEEIADTYPEAWRGAPRA